MKKRLKNVDNFIAFTYKDSIINLNNTKILKVATPTNLTDAANKQYIDNAIANLPVKVGDGFQSMVQKVVGNFAEGDYSSAFGLNTSAEAGSAHAEGNGTKAKGVASHAEGVQTETNGNASHAEGLKTITKNKAEHAEGNFNLPLQDKTIHTVGIGTSDTNRKNAEERMLT